MTTPCITALAITVLVAVLQDIVWRKRQRRWQANDGLRRWVQARSKEVL